MNKEYVYYCTQRPPTLGAVPTFGLLYVESFPDRQYVPEIDRMAWGRVVYRQELTPADVGTWELVMKPREGL